MYSIGVKNKMYKYTGYGYKTCLVNTIYILRGIGDRVCINGVKYVSDSSVL